MGAEDHQALPLLFSRRGVIGCSGHLELSTCGASAVPNGRWSLCAADCAPVKSLSGSLHYGFSPSLIRPPESFLNTDASSRGEALDLEARVAFVSLPLLVPSSPRAVSVALCHKPSGPMCVLHHLLERRGVRERTR